MKSQDSRRFRTVCAAAFATVTLGGGLLGCASAFLQFENSAKVLENKEYDSAIQVKELEAPAPVAESEEAAKTPDDSNVQPKATPKPTPKPKATPVPRAKRGAKAAAEPTPPPRRQPILEDEEGFQGRRPLKDPFTVGEEVVMDISYFAVAAGELTMQTRSFAEVNGRRAYRFRAIAKTVSVFEMFYKVDDTVDILFDYETLMPFSYVLDIKESNVLRNSRAIHQWGFGTNPAVGDKPDLVQYWDKKITKDGGVEEKKIEWEAPPFSQSAFSALWYLRAFQLTPGKKVQFYIAHENENLLITCEVLRREELRTKAGTFKTVVIRPTATKDGKPHNIGTNLFWVTDDDSKLMIRMETKIKIGTIVGSLSRIKRGTAQP
ncbi:MAG: DUF3108 domain-containing protein [Bdellovibrionales bacterium]|nr:DUF3108 domain-containing protein [Bdellovibrionales bacterium]